MAGSYDISTVVSRSYIPEQLQDNMQKGAENKNAFFMAEFRKDSDRKGKTVQKAEGAENPAITENAVKREDERKKRGRRREKGSNGGRSGGKRSSGVDFTV